MPPSLCKHICLNTPGSYVCYCHLHFYLEPDDKSCKTKGARTGCFWTYMCSQLPFDLVIWSFQLSFPACWFLKGDQTASRINNKNVFKLGCPPDEPLLLASVQSELWLLGVHSGSLTLLSSVNRPVFSLDYHWAQQRVYWLSPDYQSIRWVDIKKSNSRGTLIKGTTTDKSKTYIFF